MSTTPHDLYNYAPSIPAAVIFCIIFAVLSIAHGQKVWSSKAWFCIPFVIGGIFEFIGYIGRLVGHSDPSNLAAFIVQYLTILLAPALFAASIYMTLGRLIRASGLVELSLVRVDFMTKIFVGGDTLSFITQLAGGGMQAAKDPSKIQAGQRVLLVGLWIQIAFFGFFVVTSTVFHRRMLRSSISLEKKRSSEYTLYVLHAVSVLILIRSIYRVVEYIQGTGGYLLSTEWPVYVFDAGLMTLVMIVYYVRFPSSLKSSPEEADSEKELSTFAVHV